MLEILEDDNLKYAFNMIWETTSKYRHMFNVVFSCTEIRPI